MQGNSGGCQGEVHIGQEVELFGKVKYLSSKSVNHKCHKRGCGGREGLEGLVDEREGEGDCELDLGNCVKVLRQVNWGEESGGDVLGGKGFKDGF